MTHPILVLLAEASARVERAERKIADAERERNDARIEVAAYERAAQAIGLQGEFPLPVDNAAQALEPKRVRAPKVASPQNAWARVFQLLHKRHTDGFGYDEIASAADELGIAYKRPSLRTKMMNYVNDNAMERVGSGKFRVSDQGMAIFEIDASPNENGEAEASPDADGAATSSNESAGDYNRLFS